MESHKHKGVVKRHLLSVQHKDTLTIKEHNKALTPKQQAFIQGVSVPKKDVKPKSFRKLIADEVREKIFGKKEEKQPLDIVLDEDGYLYCDATKLPNYSKGLRIKFIKTEGNKKRIIGLQIEK
jgi:hypothetical protein